MKKLTKTELDQRYTETCSKINGYVLHGVTGEIMLVIKSYDQEIIMAVINKIGSSRIEDLQVVSQILERDLNDRDSRNISSTRSKDKTKSASRRGGGSTKAKNSKHRS
jgi:hypothetical protein